MTDPLAAAADHPHVRAVLGGALPPDGHPSHAYLFHGPPGCGKAETARAFAAALIADGERDPADAARRVHEGVHPDFTWVTPSGASEMLVSDVDEAVVAASTRTPFESRRRVFVLEHAELMGEEAANRMLKTLEEPPPFAHLVLLVDRLGDVLPTIRSRCQLVRFEAPTAEQLVARLSAHGVPGPSAEAPARLALGDARRALALALGDGPALRQAAEAYARQALRGDLLDAPWKPLIKRAAELGETAGVAVAERFAADLDFLPQKERARAKREADVAVKRAQRRGTVGALDQALQLVGLWYRDAACVLDGAEDLVHAVDRLDALREDTATQKAPHALRSAVGIVDETRMALRVVNATPELALEALAYRLRAALS